MIPTSYIPTSYGTTHSGATHHHDTFDARAWRIREKLLDRIEEALDDLAPPRAMHTAIDHDAAREQSAALLCRHALCRRAQSCRRQPCALPASAFDTTQADRSR